MFHPTCLAMVENRTFCDKFQEVCYTTQSPFVSIVHVSALSLFKCADKNIFYLLLKNLLQSVARIAGGIVYMRGKVLVAEP